MSEPTTQSELSKAIDLAAIEARAKRVAEILDRELCKYWRFDVTNGCGQNVAAKSLFDEMAKFPADILALTSAAALAGEREAELVKELDRVKILRLDQVSSMKATEKNLEREAAALTARLSTAEASNDQLIAIGEDLGEKALSRGERLKRAVKRLGAMREKLAAVEAERDRARKIIEDYELDYDRVVIRGEKCAMQLAQDEAAALRTRAESADGLLRECESYVGEALEFQSSEAGARALLSRIAAHLDTAEVKHV